MFSNRIAIETLVITDNSASEEEKSSVLEILKGIGRRLASKSLIDDGVVSFEDAARILGYKSTRGVYAAVRNGVLKGYYGGPMAQRASGVLASSVNERLALVRGVGK